MYYAYNRTARYSRMKQQEHIKLSFSDIIEEVSDDDKGVVPSLVEPHPPNSPNKEPKQVDQYDDVHIEITLNHPRTHRFCNMTSDEQKVLYNKLFQKMIEKLPIPLVKTTIQKTFEYCKTGHIHLHACVIYSLPTGKYYSMGLIADLVKKYLSLIKQVYQDKYCFPELQRYRSPSIVCQYFNGDLKRREIWLSYIHKEIYNQ